MPRKDGNNSGISGNGNGNGTSGTPLVQKGATDSLSARDRKGGRGGVDLLLRGFERSSFNNFETDATLTSPAARGPSPVKSVCKKLINRNQNH